MNDLSDKEIKKVKESVAIKVGDKIRQIREQKGLTQVELANKIHSDRQYLYKIEHAKVGISIAKLAVIAKALGVPMTILVDVE